MDNLNAFERLETILNIHERLQPKVEARIQEMSQKEDSELAKNPKEKGFSKKNRVLKTNKRKNEFLSHLGMGVPGEDPELHFSSIPFENAKFAKIQSLELEEKLKSDYWPHKKGPSKVMVAPSPIHRYGLFALEK